MFRDRNGVERWKCWSGGHGGTAVDAVDAAFAAGDTADITLVNSTYGWEPEITLREGLTRMIEWFRTKEDLT